MEIPDDISQASISVLQANDSLSEDDSRAGCWPLATLGTAAKVQVVVSGHNRPITVPLGHDVWLLFKLSGRGLEQGRMVQHVSSGSYLAIVPKAWQRDEEKAGSPPTTPEPAFLEGYLAHFFDLPESASSRIAFRNQLGQSIVIDSGGPRFHLVGPKIHDESGRMGPLFGGSPPRLGIMNGHWSDVQTIVVGQEGSGHQRWRENFEPRADRTQQELPHEVLERQAGWYFLRFYDSSDTLIDSLDFRFVAGLKEISIPTAGPVPSPDGHVAQTVEVHHDASYNVMPAGQECAGLKMEQGTGKTIVTIPPRAECDRTRWYIHPANSHGKEVEFTILIERLWWTLGTFEPKPSDWVDRPVRLSPEDFTAASNKAIWLRLPKPGAVSVVSAGFRQENSRKLPVRVTDNTVRIPLRDFSAAQELDDRASEHEFKIWLEIEERTHHATVAVLAAQPHGGAVDLTTIPAHRLATLLTRLRRAARGPTRWLIKDVRRKYRRQRRSQPVRNEGFIKESLCLIAILLEEMWQDRQVGFLLSERWKARAERARRECPDLVRQLRVRLVGKDNGGSL